MSYLIPPRLTFFGDSYANASTANNNDLAGVYDIDTLQLYPSMMTYPQSSVIAPNGASNPFQWSGAGSNPDLRKWLMGLMQIPVTPDGFNEDAPDKKNAHGQMAHWNYYGDHNTEFRKTFINAATLADGTRAGAEDVALGLQVELLGDIFYGRRRGAVMVDADPYGLITTQIFSGQFRISLPQSTGNYPIIIADHPTPAYSYFINPNRNLNPACEGFQGVSAVFQFGLKKENLSFDPMIAKSASLSSLQQHAMQEQGLMVRYCFYDAVFKTEAIELNGLFSEGQYVFNPYVGKVLGTIGVWHKDELASAPAGRMLRIQNPYQYIPPKPPATRTQEELAANRRTMATVARYTPREPLADKEDVKTARLGITLAQVSKSNSVVSLDCISTFPESTPGQQDEENSRPKFDLGEVNLVLLYQDKDNKRASVTIGRIPNNEATYESEGGIVEVSYADNPDRATIERYIDQGQLALEGPDFKFPENSDPYPLIETASCSVQTDNRAVYFDASVRDSATGTVTTGTSQITIQVQYRGVKQTAPTDIHLEYWMVQKTTTDANGNTIPLINPDKPQVPVPLGNPYFKVKEAVSSSVTTYGSHHVMTDRVTVQDGTLTLNLSAMRPGVSLIRFTDPNFPVTPNFAWDNVDYAIVRILPFDDYSNVPDATINNWDFMYAEVFGFYSVLYPLMSKVIPWGPDGAPNNPADVKQFASQMLAFTDPAMWNSTIYMPITRDMSGGKRELLRRWCNLQQ